MDIPTVGTRLNLSGFLATVKFAGHVDNTSGTWLGVEWDDPKRGKHDGLKDGKRYFTCRMPNAGSFIRPSANISYGVSFIEALKRKYIDLPHGSASQEMYTLGSSNIQVEAVNLNKIRLKFANLSKLREISLDGEDVAKGDGPGEINATCPNVRGLDLSKSLLPNWESLALITTELPMLWRLAVNRTRLQTPQHLSSLTSAFENLTDLELNATMMTWQDMQYVAAAMPNLRMVELGYNEIARLVSRDVGGGGDSVPSAPSGIQQINLDSNFCHDWVEICQALSTYSSLQRIMLTSNRIATIPFPREQEQPYFQSLMHLSLSHNLLNAWSDIDALSRWCPRLETLSIIGNPLESTHDMARFTRPFVISKIPTLVSLDAAAISSKERLDCELFYVSYITQHGPTTEEERVKEHPQWPNLCKKHGRPEEIARNRRNQLEKLSNHLISVNVYPLADSSREDSSVHTAATGSALAVRVLSTMSLKTFRMKVCKATKAARGSTARLWMKMRDGETVELDQGNDTQDLAWWGLEDGSNLLYSISVV